MRAWGGCCEGWGGFHSSCCSLVVASAWLDNSGEKCCALKGGAVGEVQETERDKHILSSSWTSLQEDGGMVTTQSLVLRQANHRTGMQSTERAQDWLHALSGQICKQEMLAICWQYVFLLKLAKVIKPTLLGGEWAMAKKIYFCFLKLRFKLLQKPEELCSCGNSLFFCPNLILSVEKRLPKDGGRAFKFHCCATKMWAFSHRGLNSSSHISNSLLCYICMLKITCLVPKLSYPSSHSYFFRHSYI